MRLFGVRKAGIERGGDASSRHHAEIGEVKLGARLRLQRNHVADFNADSTQAHGGPLHAVANFGPGIGAILAASDWLFQRGLLAVDGRGLFEHGIDGPRGHDVILTCAGLNLVGLRLV